MCHDAILNFVEKVTFFLPDDEHGQRPDPFFRDGELRDSVLLESAIVDAHGIHIISKNFALFRALRGRAKDFLDAGMVALLYCTVIAFCTSPKAVP